jgi:hypothetical protein
MSTESRIIARDAAEADTKLAAIKALRERVEGATGAFTLSNPEACDITVALGVAPSDDAWFAANADIVAACAGSIDAALALVGRCLPGLSHWVLENGGDGDHGCSLHDRDGEIARSDWIVGPASLAILSALLMALEASQ